jgi:hypothetical protein
VEARESGPLAQGDEAADFFPNAVITLSEAATSRACTPNRDTLKFTLSRQGEKALEAEGSRASAQPTTATDKSLQLDLVALAREILDESVRVTTTDTNLSPGDSSSTTSNTEIPTQQDSRQGSGRSVSKMTAVEHHAPPHSFMGEKQPESPTARFTAVNGRDSAPSGSVTPSNAASNGHPRRGSEDRAHGQPRISPPGQEKLTITTSSAHRDERPSNGTLIHSTYTQASSYPENESSLKRKRSDSHDTPAANPSGTNYHSYGVPKSAQDDTSEKASRGTYSPQNGSESYNSSQAPVYSYPSKTPDHDRSNWLETPTEQTPPSHTDDQIREALTRDNQGSEGHGEHSQASPGDDDSSFQAGYGDNRTLVQREDERKKRKRNFSNRTKTGCMTCRKRKKKCDETRPEC